MCFFIQSCEPLEKEKPQKKSTKKKESTSFFHEPCVLPASPSSLSPHFSTDRNMTVANLHVLATQINIAVWGKVPNRGKSCPRLLFHSWNPLGLQCCPVPLEQGLSLSGMQEPAHLLWAQPDSKCRAPPGPPFSRWNPPPPIPVGVVKALLGWAGTWFSSNCKMTQPSAAWWDPPFPAPTHTCRLATAAFCDCLVQQEQV